MDRREISELEIIVRDRLYNSYPISSDLALCAAHDIIDDLLKEHLIERKPYIEVA